ncbi:RasGEF domain containing protein [Histomonas meleagridis]|uniref:RasGEF domain containing protein n=1 Tax=Histomonas meleagridis TaxID=135588 RepID=UPI0035599923|nr:RasGEF domain containing protein [Histomonas meleagridis]KAH0800081.1 RasGEF domain containing protein [Histomonas meleagridis]
MSEENQQQAQNEGISAEERSLFMCRILEEDPDALEFRERTYPWTHSHSLGVLKNANFSTCRSHLNRHKVLELVYQHLHSIGMHHVAFTLSEETKLEFQRKDQKMERTDLRLLVSMSLGPRDDLWDNTGIESTILAKEPFDHDSISVRYVEPVSEIVNTYLDPESNVGYLEGSEHQFEGITYSPLRNLIVAIVRGEPISVSESDRSEFILTVNSFCQNEHLFHHLRALYESDEVDSNRKDNIMNFINDWVRFWGLFIGSNTLKQITHFLQKVKTPISEKLLSDIPSLSFGHPYPNDSPPPEPFIEDPTKILNPNFILTDADPCEVARQISLYTHHIYSAIHLREFYSAITTRTLSLDTKTINELFEFGRRLKLIIASTILNDKYSSNCIKQFEIMVNVAKMLLEMNNFEALSWFISAFEMNCIENLKRSVDKLPEGLSETLKNLEENYSWKLRSKTYEEKLKKCFDEKLPTIPNMRYELSIVTQSAYKGDDFVNNRINWAKRKEASKYLSKYIRFQNIKYNFHRIAQIQNLLTRKCKSSKKEIEEMSLHLE